MTTPNTQSQVSAPAPTITTDLWDYSAPNLWYQMLPEMDIETLASQEPDSIRISYCTISREYDVVFGTLSESVGSGATLEEAKQIGNEYLAELESKRTAAILSEAGLTGEWSFEGDEGCVWFEHEGLSCSLRWKKGLWRTYTGAHESLDFTSARAALEDHVAHILKTIC